MVDSETQEVGVVIPAAGQGRRIGGKRKQLRPLGGASILRQTVGLFDKHPAVDWIVVVGPDGDTSPIIDELEDGALAKLEDIVEGGSSRQESVHSGLQALPDDVRIVLVHDAVRPLISARLINRVIGAAREEGAAAPAIPIQDTLRRADGNHFGATVSRDGLYRVQTPQAFRWSWILSAHKEAVRSGSTATDDVELVQEVGFKVAIVPGSSWNIKITTPDDLSLVRALWAASGSEDPPRE